MYTSVLFFSLPLFRNTQADFIVSNFLRDVKTMKQSTARPGQEVNRHSVDVLFEDYITNWSRCVKTFFFFFHFGTIFAITRYFSSAFEYNPTFGFWKARQGLGPEIELEGLKWFQLSTLAALVELQCSAKPWKSGSCQHIWMTSLNNWMDVHSQERKRY